MPAPRRDPWTVSAVLSLAGPWPARRAACRQRSNRGANLAGSPPMMARVSGRLSIPARDGFRRSADRDPNRETRLVRPRVNTTFDDAGVCRPPGQRMRSPSLSFIRSSSFSVKSAS